jgi:imidazolonepropionase-like amidohydrolase
MRGEIRMIKLKKDLHIINGRIHTMTADGIIERGELYIRKGLIISMGQNLDVPEGTALLDAGGALVMPGLIDAHCHAGIFESGMGTEGNDGNETSDPVTPELRGIDGINPRCEAFEEGLKGGVTCVATGPGSANSIGGQFVAMKTWGTTLQNMVVKEPLAMKCAFGENPKNVYGASNRAPVTRMANAALIRKSLARAKEYVDKKEKSLRENKAELMPDWDQQLEALEMVIRKQIPLKAHAHRADDLLTALRIAEEFDVDITLDHCTEGHLIVDELVASGKGLIIGPSLAFRSKPELRNSSLSTAGILAAAGAKIAIMTDLPCVPLSMLPLCVGVAIKGGLSEDEAFLSVTRNAAEILGLQNQIGSLKSGLDGDVAIFDGNPFTDLTTRCLYTVVEGNIVHHSV